MSSIPVLTLDRVQVGAQGLTVGRLADPGGSSDPGSVTIPIIAPRLADERQWCVEVSQFVHEGQAPDLAGCPAYRSGRCARAGAGVACAFHEDADNAIWDRARAWRYVEGLGMVHRDLWDRFGIAE